MTSLVETGTIFQNRLRYCVAGYPLLQSRLSGDPLSKTHLMRISRVIIEYCG